MIYVEEQENYENAPIVVGVSNYYYNSVNPFDVVGGLLDKGKDTYEKGRALVDTIKGGEVSTNIGGFDINVKPYEEQPKKPFYKSPIFIGGTVVVALIGGYLIYNHYSKKNQ